MRCEWGSYEHWYGGLNTLLSGLVRTLVWRLGALAVRFARLLLAERCRSSYGPQYVSFEHRTDGVSAAEREGMAIALRVRQAVAEGWTGKRTWENPVLASS